MTHDEITLELQAAHARDPRTAPFGVFTSDPHPFGIGMFFWYESREALERALLDLHPYVAGADELDERRERWAEARGRLQAILERDRELSPTGAKAAGKVTFPLFCLDWWGTFDDLCSRHDDWAVSTREHYRSMAESDVLPGTPILSDEIEAFIEEVRAYGY